MERLIHIANIVANTVFPKSQKLQYDEAHKTNMCSDNKSVNAIYKVIYEVIIFSPKAVFCIIH